ncbi:NAD(P)H-dependent oxidoreductase [uncultured Pontibacter sp.]|uniref:flavodoxin family protein n=1 Tax=uncultured Pontibacter sp. TaxID=453356 RepID=UPI00261A4B80|nr:NAD(P)H-dependent oxidoreductase [uncultured Pontibacter sp.]
MNLVFMPTKPLIILGSARKSGDTAKLVTSLFRKEDITLIDLLDYNISPYDYDARYAKDDTFMEVVELMMKHQQIVFATPVYWYAMSGLMKNFFDRLTDFVTTEKPIGRSMNGKQTFLVAIGAEETLPLGFEEPFRLTSSYFDMEFIATLYCKSSETNVESIIKDTFIARILSST